MDPVGDQALRFGKNAGGNLRDGQQKIDDDADPSAFRRRRCTLGVGVRAIVRVL